VALCNAVLLVRFSSSVSQHNATAIENITNGIIKEFSTAIAVDTFRRDAMLVSKLEEQSLNKRQNLSFRSDRPCLFPGYGLIND